MKIVHATLQKQYRIWDFKHFLEMYNKETIPFSDWRWHNCHFLSDNEYKQESMVQDESVGIFRDFERLEIWFILL